MAYIESNNSAFQPGLGVSFKCGSQEALEPYILGAGKSATIKGKVITGKKAEEGVFYLTNDTSRLYVGNSGKAVPVNQGVITYTSVADLPATGEHGQFYYCQAENILAVYAGKGLNDDGSINTTGSGWVQINANTDTIVESFTKVVSSVTGGAKITSTLKDNNGKTQDLVDTVEFIGGDGVNITATDADTITISADDSELVSAASTETGKIKLTGFDSGEVDFKVNYGAADNKFTSTDNGEVILNLKNEVVSDAKFAANADQGFNLTIHTGNTGRVESSTDLDPTITYDGKTVHFVGGDAELDVYSKATIDQKIEGLNAMHYIGTVGIGGSKGQGIIGKEIDALGVVLTVSKITGSNAPSNYKIGDTFLVTSNLTTEDGSGTECVIKAGSLLIAMGTESTTPDENGNKYITSGTLYFEVVNESYEKDTTYSFERSTATNGGTVSLKPSTGGSTGTITIVGDGDHITGSIAKTASGKDHDSTITISHKEATVTRTTSGVEADAKTSLTKAETTILPNNYFEVVDSIEDDGHGHISKVNTKTLQMGDFNTIINSDTMTTSVSNNVGTITHSVTAKTGSLAATAAKTSSFDLKSDTFTITDADTSGGNAGLKINMVWGSF